MIIRACGLNLRAAKATNPLMAQSLALATFTLGVDHWVRIDRTGLTVGYKGAERTTGSNWGGPGWVFLPTRHTQLDVTRPIETRRHFIEFFIWIPQEIAGTPAWILTWWVYEVVGVEATPVQGDGGIVAVGGQEPPTSFRVEDVARIVVNADGEAERLASGAYPRRILLPSPGSR